MIENQRKLTFFESTSIITGYGVAGGIMAVPYLATMNGLVNTLIIMVAAYLISVLLHLMIADMCVREEGSNQIVELFQKYLFKGRFGNLLAWLFFGLLTVILLFNLSVYILGAGEIVVSLTGLPLWTGMVLFYVIAAGVVAFGLKVLGISEKYAIGAIIVIFTILIAGSFSVPFQAIPAITAIGNETIALFGMLMFCFGSFFSVPQAVEGLSWNKKLIPYSVFAGIGLNFIFVIAITFFSLSISTEVTEVAIIGWTAAMGSWASILGSVFMLLAMLTTYWSLSYALVTIVKERLGWSEKLSWMTATLPTLAIALVPMSGFLDLIRVVGGGIAVVVALLLVPAFRASRINSTTAGFQWSLGLWGGSAFQILVLGAYIITAIGSFVEIP